VGPKSKKPANRASTGFQTNQTVLLPPKADPEGDGGNEENRTVFYKPHPWHV